MTPAELELRLVTGMARKAVDELAPDISGSPQLFAHLLELAAGPQRPKNSKAAYLVRHICEYDRTSLSTHGDAVVKAMDHAEHPGVRRDMLKVCLLLNNHELFDTLADRCLLYLRRPGEATGVKYYSMMVLKHVVVRWPELIPEFTETLSSQLGLVTDAFDRNARKLISKLEQA